MTSEEQKIIYFTTRDAASLDKTLRRVKERAEELGIRSIILASTKGETGVKATEMLKGHNVVIVTHHFGFHEPNTIELTDENRRKILANGGKLLTTTHAFGGIGRAVRKKFNTMQTDEIVANTLRIFGEGMKVALEIALMAADAGLVRTDENVIAVGKWDTAIVTQPANVSNFFNARVKEILCMPHL